MKNPQQKQGNNKKSYHKVRPYRLSDDTHSRFEKRKIGTWEHTMSKILDKLDEYENTDRTSA